MEVIVARNDLWRQLNDYNVPKENLERKILEQDDILRAVAASVKQLEKRLSLLGNAKRSFEKN